MAVETKWLAVLATPLTANGTAFGVVTVADTAGFKVKGSAYLVANTLSPLQVQIQRVINSTQMIVGPPGSTPSPSNFINVSAYTTALNAQIGFPEQPKNKIKPDDIEQAVYEADPVVALRTIFVDQYGNFYNDENPLPIAFDGTISVGTVTITNLPNPVDTNYGASSASTIRTAAQIGNSTGGADFDSGSTSSQTLRASANLSDGSGNKITSTPIGPKQALDVNIVGESISLEVGTPDQSTFTYGSSLEQAVGGVYQDTGASLSSGQTGAVRLTQNRAFHTNLRTSSGSELDFNYGIVSANTLRTASLIGNATGAADFGGGLTTSQTLRVVLPTDQTVIPVSDSTTHIGLTQIDTDLNTFAAQNHTDLTKVDTDLLAFKSANHTDLTSFAAQNHTDLVQIDTDLLSFKSANHTDLTTINTSINSAATQAHTDAVQIDTDLLAFKSANHTDLTTINTSIGTQTSDLNSFAVQNHTDLTQIDSDLLAFKAANHTDLTALHNDSLTTQTDINNFASANHTDLTQIDTDIKSVQAANGTALPVNTTLMGGSDGTDIRSLSTDNTGKLNLNNISGTVSLPTGASTAANQTNGSQKTQIVDGNGAVVGPEQTISGTNYLPVVLAASATPGSALVPRSIQIAGSDGVNAQTISVDSTGKININNISGTISLPTNAAQENGGHLASIDSKLADNYGVATGALRTASQIGNATGAADFNEGTNSAQTLRVSANIARNGNELSYNAGASDANTLRTASNLKREGNDLDYNYGTVSPNTLRVAANIANSTGLVDYNFGVVGAQTIRTASEVGNATGAADFNEGANSAQTLRVSANIARNGNELSYNAGSSDANTVRVSSNLYNNGAALDYNFGVASLNSLRTASLIGNATGAADFGTGSATAQTLRVTSANFPVTVDTNYGIVGASTLRSASQIGNATGAANFNFGIVGAQTLRTASQVGNANGAADFNAGVTSAQTLRTASNLYDGSANAITSSSINSKQRLDVNLPSEGQSGSSVPFDTVQIGGSDGTNLRTLATDTTGKAKTELFDSLLTGNGVNATYRDELRATTSTCLVGAPFTGSTIDSNMWTNTFIGSGTSTVASGFDQLSTGTTANSSTVLNSNFRAKFVAGTVNAFYGITKLGDTGVANNIRRWGAYDTSNGVYFVLNGTTIGVGIRSNGSDTVFTSFNGPNAFVLDTNIHQYEIQYTTAMAYFFQDNKLIHTYSATTSPLSTTPHYLLGFETTNSGGSTTNASISIISASILRYGEQYSRPRYFHPIYTTRIQSKTASNAANSTTITATLNSPTTAGSTIIVVAGSETGTLTVTDSASQTYSTATTLAAGTDNTYIFYVSNSVAGVTSVTITDASSTGLAMVVSEYRNIAISSSLDKTSTLNNGNVTSWTSNSTTATTQTNELLIGAAFATAHASTTFTAGTNWSAVGTIAAGPGNLVVFSEEQYVASTGTYAATGTTSAADTVLGHIATFKILNNTYPNGFTIPNVPTVVTTNAGTLKKVVVNTLGATSSSVTLYDGLNTSGTLIATISLTNAIGDIEYDLDFSNGLTIVVNSTTADFTLVYD